MLNLPLKTAGRVMYWKHRLKTATIQEKESLRLTEAQRDEPDRRVAVYYSSPDDSCLWEDVKNRIKSME